MSNKIKPCPLCGNNQDKAFMMLDKIRRFSFKKRWACQIVCSNFKCGNYSLAHGFTKKHTYKKAVRIWNKEADRLSKLPQWIRFILK